MKIAIVRLSAMGDIIHSMAVLPFLKETFGEIRIDWVCDEAFAPLLEGHPLIHRVIPIPLKALKKERTFSAIWAQIKRLRSFGPYDRVIDMQGLIKSALIARILKGPAYGYDRHSLREAPAALFYKRGSRVAYGLNVIQRAAELVNDVLGSAITKEMLMDKPPYLFYTQEAKEEVRGWLPSVPFAVIVTGASWPSKIYPPFMMAHVAKALGMPVVVTWGSQTEEMMAEEIVDNCPDAVKAPRLSLQGLVALIDRAVIVVGGDTGPTHIAWAQNIPSVTIFGPTPYFRNTLETPRHRTVHIGEPIDPKRLDRHDYRIMMIRPEAVVRAAKEALAQASGPAKKEL